MDYSRSFVDPDLPVILAERELINAINLLRNDFLFLRQNILLSLIQVAISYISGINQQTLSTLILTCNLIGLDLSWLIKICDL